MGTTLARGETATVVRRGAPKRLQPEFEFERGAGGGCDPVEVLY